MRPRAEQLPCGSPVVYAACQQRTTMPLLTISPERLSPALIFSLVRTALPCASLACSNVIDKPGEEKYRRVKARWLDGLFGTGQASSCRVQRAVAVVCITWRSANNPDAAAGQFADVEPGAAPLPLQASNAAYQSKLGCRPGGKEAMAAIGFK